MLNDKCLGEFSAQVFREIGHLIEGLGTLVVQPIKYLLSAVPFESRIDKQRFQFFNRQTEEIQPFHTRKK